MSYSCILWLAASPCLVCRRLRSHVNHILSLIYNRTIQKSTAESDASAWRRLAPAAVDNYAIRSLLGPSVFHLPVGALNAKHAESAQSLLLEQFDTLLILEDEPANNVMLRSGLGWSNGMLPHTNAHSSFRVQRTKISDTSQVLLQAALHDLERSNELDRQVYEHARLLQKLDMLTFLVAAGIAKSAEARLPVAGVLSNIPDVLSFSTASKRRCGYILAYNMT